MQNFSEGQHLATIRDEGAIYSATEDGRVPFISADDIAACAVAALPGPTALNRDFVLTGPKAISYDEAAQAIGEAAGRQIAHLRISAESLAARYRDAGRPAMLAQMLGVMDTMIAAGAEDRVTESIRELTGRAPIGFDAFARASAELWTATSLKAARGPT
jgi:uncharacterized protein YbjT (DUF2867 family)